MGLNKRRVELLVLCICTMALCACGRQQPDSKNHLYAGVACYNKSDTFLSQFITCLKDQFDQLGSDDFEVSMTVRDAAGLQRTQDDQVKELIAAGCNILCVNLVDRADPSEIINLAREKNIPIIFFNREPVAEDMMQWDGLYYVGADAEQSGVMQGELAADVIKSGSMADRNKDGKIQFVILEGEPGHQDAIIRTESAVETLKKQGIVLEKLCCSIANWNRAQAQNRMMQIIGQYQNKIELVLANNDDMALGAVDAYKKLNYTESALPVFLGIDGTDAGLEAVIEGKLAGTVYNDKEKQAQAIAKLAVSIIKKGDAAGEGTKAEEKTGEGKTEDVKNKYIYLPYSKVTSGNAAGFLGKEGDNVK